MNSDQGSLIMLIGLPGSGKSTWARQFIEQQPNYRLIATDDVRYQLYGDEAVQGEWLHIWRTVLGQLKAARAAISAGQLTGVIYDATNARRRHRREFIQAAKDCGYPSIHALWLDTALAVCLARNQMRTRRVPTAIIEKMHRQLTAAPPSEAEGFASLKKIA
ncbi:MAG: AAA family ATPase [Cyanobacteria bacterium P01_D01_bin.105]